MQQVNPKEIPADATLIDVREPHEFKSVHAENATNMPLSDIQDWAHDLKRDEPIYVICRSGGRSSQAVNHLTNVLGYDNIINVAGGTMRWVEEGLPKVGDGMA